MSAHRLLARSGRAARRSQTVCPPQSQPERQNEGAARTPGPRHQGLIRTNQSVGLAPVQSGFILIFLWAIFSLQYEPVICKFYIFVKS